MYPFVRDAVTTTGRRRSAGGLSFGLLDAVTRPIVGFDEWTRAGMHESAYTTGLSARNRFGHGNYEVTGSVTASRVTGEPEAITPTTGS